MHRGGAVICLLLFSFMCLLSLKLEVNAAGVAYIHSKSIIYPEGRNYILIEETATLSITIYGDAAYLLTLRVRGENITVYPSSEENVSLIRGYAGITEIWYKTVEFKLKPHISGSLSVNVALLHENTQIDFTSLSLNVYENPSVPVQIVRGEKYTFINPTSVFLDSPGPVLKVTLSNLGRFEENVQVKVHSQNVEVEPEQQNLTVRAFDTSSIEFRLNPQISGTFVVVVELWLNNSLADLHNLSFSAHSRSTIILSIEAVLMPFLIGVVISTIHFLKFRREYGYGSWVSWGYGIAVFFIALIIVLIAFSIQGAFSGNSGNIIIFDWIWIHEAAKTISFLTQTPNPEATIFNVSLSVLTFVLVSYVSFLGLKQILDKYITIACGILIGLLSAITVYRLIALQNFYETLFTGFGFLPALILLILIALIFLGLSKRIKLKQ